MCLSMLSFGMSAADGDAVLWLQKTHNFGTIAEADGKVTCKMGFVNIADSAIVITEVRPTCGCTAASYPRRPIEPGDTAFLTFVFNPFGYLGGFSKDVVVRLSAQPRRTVLKIEGSVIGKEQTVSKRYPVAVGSLRIDNRILPFGELTKGGNRNAYLSGYNTGRDSIRVYAETPKFLSVKFMPDTIAPGGLCSIIVHFDSSKCPNDWGATKYTFHLLSEPLHENAQAYAGITQISAIANLSEDFSKLSEKDLQQAPVIGIDDNRVDFGRMGYETVTRTLSITNTGKRKLEIRKLICPDTENVSVSIDHSTIKHGKKATVTVTAKLPADSDLAYLNSTLTIVSNDPANPSKTVRLVGTRF